MSGGRFLGVRWIGIRLLKRKSRWNCQVQLLRSYIPATMSEKEKSQLDDASQKGSDFGTQKAADDVFAGESIDPIYHQKAQLLNNALQEIGMGKYQVQMDSSATRFFPPQCLVVGSVRRNRFWMVGVSTTPFHRSLLTLILRSDNLWPV